LQRIGANLMSVVTIPLSEEQLRKLHEKARRLRVTPEVLLMATLEDLLARPEEDFRRAVEYVVRKNAELYRRLATGA